MAKHNLKEKPILSIAYVEIFSSFKETRIPLIKLSKSKDGCTGSATFLFIKPKAFNKAIVFNSSLNSVKLISNKYKISTTNLHIFFKKGKPFFLKALFLFIKKEDYFLFFNFINLYANKKKLTYFKDFKSVCNII